jgi:hypothetical protein
MEHIKNKLNLFFKYQIGKYFIILFIIFGNGSVFTSPKQGQCVGDCENGKGKFIFEKSLDQYEGNFLDGKFHGYGILKIYKGKNKKVKIFDIYEGMFSFDQMEGEGIYKYANGDTISGIFSKNKLNGIGTARNGYIDKNYGYIYSGTFKENKFNGYGVYKYPDGSFYTGEFKEGKMSGLGFIKKGKLITFIHGYDKMGKPEKSYSYTLSSDFFIKIKDGKKQKEKMVKKESFMYGGDLESNTLDGIGFSVTENGKIYFGEWNEDNKNGTGLFLYPNGILYIGVFDNNQLNGFGLKFDKDGDLLYSGEWEKGKRKN